MGRAQARGGKAVLYYGPACLSSLPSHVPSCLNRPSSVHFPHLDAQHPSPRITARPQGPSRARRRLQLPPHATRQRPLIPWHVRPRWRHTCDAAKRCGRDDKLLSLLPHNSLLLVSCSMLPTLLMCYDFLQSKMIAAWHRQQECDEAQRCSPKPSDLQWEEDV